MDERTTDQTNKPWKEKKKKHLLILTNQNKKESANAPTHAMNREILFWIYSYEKWSKLSWYDLFVRMGIGKVTMLYNVTHTFSSLLAPFENMRYDKRKMLIGPISLAYLFYFMHSTKNDLVIVMWSVLIGHYSFFNVSYLEYFIIYFLCNVYFSLLPLRSVCLCRCWSCSHYTKDVI